MNVMELKEQLEHLDDYMEIMVTDSEGNALDIKDTSTGTLVFFVEKEDDIWITGREEILKIETEVYEHPDKEVKTKIF